MIWHDCLIRANPIYAHAALKTHRRLACPVGGRRRCDGAVAAAAPASATIRLSSGRHEPQLVPARSASPMPVTLAAAPVSIAARMVASPTLKQAHTIGPVLVRPSAERPDSS